MDSAGNFVWVKSFGGLSYDGCSSICKDNLGNIYLTGAFGLTVDFDPGVGVNYISSLGGYDAFIQNLIQPEITCGLSHSEETCLMVVTL
ncbi:MAG: hypothetical protein IPJ26_02760 [Bacteroidetes bacterium]|nr:hypothetical protein [Bacteroidota bacterium]